MSVVFVMAPIALLLAAVFVWAFVWAARDGQFDDTDTPAHRVLFDDDSGSRSDPSIEPVSAGEPGEQGGQR